MRNNDGETPRAEEYAYASPFVAGRELPAVPDTPIGSSASLATTQQVPPPDLAALLLRLQMQVTEKQAMIGALLQSFPPGLSPQMLMQQVQPMPM